MSAEDQYRARMAGTNGPTPAAPAVALTWFTADELRAHTPIEPDWTWHGLAARGAVTLLSGKPKSGKSTVILAAIEAIAAGAPAFLGRAITGTPVVYVSEETAGTLAHKLPRPGTNVHVLSREHAWPKPAWPALVAAAVQRARDHDATLIVLDTLAYWAAMGAEAEKDAGAAGAVMAPILEAAAQGIGFVIPVHERKGGGSDGEGVRGSSAFAGSVDIIVELERVTNPTHRALMTLSRFPSSPGTLVVSRDPATSAWAVVGESAERGDTRAIGDRGSILSALETSPIGLTRGELEDALGVPELQFHGTLEELRREQLVTRDGAGKRGNPYRYMLVRTVSAQPPAQKRAETEAGGSDFSAAHPVGVQQKAEAMRNEEETAPAQKPDVDVDDQLERRRRALDRRMQALPLLADDAAREAEWKALEALYAELDTHPTP